MISVRNYCTPSPKSYLARLCHALVPKRSLSYLQHGYGRYGPNIEHHEKEANCSACWSHCASRSFHFASCSFHCERLRPTCTASKILDSPFASLEMVVRELIAPGRHFCRRLLVRWSRSRSSRASSLHRPWAPAVEPSNPRRTVLVGSLVSDPQIDRNGFQYSSIGDLLFYFFYLFSIYLGFV